jgi:hypothetical protein
MRAGGAFVERSHGSHIFMPQPGQGRLSSAAAPAAPWARHTCVRVKTHPFKHTHLSTPVQTHPFEHNRVMPCTAGQLCCALRVVVQAVTRSCRAAARPGRQRARHTTVSGGLCCIGAAQAICLPRCAGAKMLCGLSVQRHRATLAVSATRCGHLCTECVCMHPVLRAACWAHSCACFLRSSRACATTGVCC